MDSADLPLAEGVVLISGTCQYEVQAILGKGCFGEVARCRNIVTEETVAIKVLMNHRCCDGDAEREVSVLEKLRCLDPERCHVVRWDSFFQDKHRCCFVFELLDISLKGIMEERDFAPLPLVEIRHITRQLATALNALKGIGVIHTDIKADNIMVTDRHQRPLNVKIIDFGFAVLIEPKHPVVIQPSFWSLFSCTAPETLPLQPVRYPWSEAKDMRSVGFVLALLAVGRAIYKVKTDAAVVTCIVETPQPANELLCEEEDRAAFADLVEQILEADEDKRITPSEVLAHRFSTDDHSCHARFHVQSILEVEDDDDLQSILEVEDDDRVEDEEDEEYDEDTSRGSSVNTFPDLTPDASAEPPSVAASDCAAEDTEDVSPTVKAWSELEEDKRKFSCGLFPIIIDASAEPPSVAASDCAAEDTEGVAPTVKAWSELEDKRKFSCGLFPKDSIGPAEHDMVQPPEEKRRKGFFRFLRELCPKRSTRVPPVAPTVKAWSELEEDKRNFSFRFGLFPIEEEEEEEDEEVEELAWMLDTSRGSSVNTFPDLTPDASAEPPSVAASDCAAEDTEDVSPTVKAWSELEEDKRKFSCGLFPIIIDASAEPPSVAASDCAAEDTEGVAPSVKAWSEDKRKFSCGLFPKVVVFNLCSKKDSIGPAEHDMVQPPEEKRRKGFFRFLRELCPKRSTRVPPVEKKLSFKNKVKAFFSKAKKLS